MSYNESPPAAVTKQVSQIQTILYILLALTLVRGVLYAVIVPPWQAPDEPAQFERVKAALTYRDWVSTSATAPEWYGDLSESLCEFNLWDYLDVDERPVCVSRSLLGPYITLYNEAYDGQYGSRPAFAAMGWPLFIFKGLSIVGELYLVRFATVLMNVIIIWLAFLMVRTIFPTNLFLAVAVPLFILFNPQHTHMLSTVNNGNLAELLATAALYFLVRGIVNGFNWLNTGAVLGLSILAMWTKATAYFLPFAIGTVGLFYLWRYRRHWTWLLPIGLVVGGLVIYFAPARLRTLLTWGWQGLWSGSFQLDPIVPIDLFRSFWAMPGWTILLIHPFWYTMWLVICLVAIAGWLVLLVTKRRELAAGQYQPQVRALIALGVAVAVAVGTLLAWNAISHSIVYRQGRSIYPVIVPISLFIVMGWYQFIPRGWHKPALLLMTVALFLFDAMILFYYIIPLFYSHV